jgi:sugar/nucleoside kinase (ribokinase family)
LPYADAAHLANAVGALSVQKLGSTAGLLSFEETVEWVKAQQNSRLP